MLASTMYQKCHDQTCRASGYRLVISNPNPNPNPNPNSNPNPNPNPNRASGYRLVIYIMSSQRVVRVLIGAAAFLALRNLIGAGTDCYGPGANQIP